MDTILEQDLARLDYDEAEIAHRRGVVMADLNRYVHKKYPELKDADVIERSKNSRSVTNGKTTSQNARTQKMQIQMAMTKEKEQHLMKSSKKKKEQQLIVLAINQTAEKANKQIPILTL
jgi:hypothetical protein